MYEINFDRVLDTFKANDDSSKRKMVSDLILSTQDDPHDKRLTAVAMRLRDHGFSKWAEALFAVASTIPWQCRIAQYEMAILWALQGKVEQAVSLFDSISLEIGLSPAQMMAVARHNARIGRFAKSRSFLEEATRLDGSLSIQAVAEFQFVSYLESFPIAYALASFEEVANNYKVYTVDEVAGRIQQALSLKQPMSLIRLGDGEGIHLSISNNDESQYCALYRRGRKEFHNIWYSGDGLLDVPEFSGEQASVQNAYRNADFLGMVHLNGIKNEYMIGSPRGIPALNNIYRFLRGLTNADSRPQSLCNMLIHRELLVGGHIQKILKNRHFLGLVSCYHELPNLLMENFSIGEVQLIKTCGETASRKDLYDPATPADAGTNFLVDHFEILDKLIEIRPGELYIVAAGFFGKIYCDIIKKRGAIAIDIGSVADIWMNIATRRFSEEEKKFSLK